MMLKQKKPTQKWIIQSLFRLGQNPGHCRNLFFFVEWFFFWMENPKFGLILLNFFFLCLNILWSCCIKEGGRDPKWFQAPCIFAALWSLCLLFWQVHLKSSIITKLMGLKIRLKSAQNLQILYFILIILWELKSWA